MLSTLFDIEAFVMMVLVGVFGVGCSCMSLYLIYKKPLLHNAYGYICGADSVFEGAVLFIFVAWMSVIVLINKELDKSLLGIILGYIVNFMYYNALYLHLLKSINRFMAIVFFVKYRIFFTNNVSKILIGVVAVISIASIGPYFSYECNFYFDNGSYIWGPRGSCDYLIYVDIPSVSVTVFISLFCDVVTFCYLHFGIKKKSSALKDDIRFLIQAFLTSLFYLGTIISFHIFAKFVETPIMKFFCTTFLWMSNHTLNQLTFILFTICKKSKSTTNVTTLSTAHPSRK